MALEQRLYQKLSQQLVMTPQLRQAIKILQVSRAELETLIDEELAQNPVLEEGVELVALDDAIAVQVDLFKFSEQLLPHRVLVLLLPDPLVDRVRVGQPHADVLVRVHDGRLVARRRTRRNKRVDIRHSFHSSWICCCSNSAPCSLKN